LNNKDIQQQLAGCLTLTVWQNTQTNYLSLQPSIQKGTQHKKPVKKKRQQHQDQVTFPVAYLKKFSVYRPQILHSRMFVVRYT